MRAAIAYNAALGTPFDAFARPAIRGAMLRTLGREGRARRALGQYADVAGTTIQAPKPISFDQAMALEASDERADVVRDLQAVAAGYIAAFSARAAQGEDALLEHVARVQISGVLQNIDANDRAAFLAHVVNGRTHDEVAGDLGVVKRTVQRMIDRATEAVRKALVERKASITG